MATPITLITGGSSGLGFEIARLCVKAGSSVCILGRTLSTLQQAKLKLEEESASAAVLALRCDVSDENSVDAAFQHIADANFALDCVFNVAGVGRFAEPKHATREMIDTVLAGNLIGLILVSSRAIAAMEERGGGIVNVMSSAAKKGNPLESVYCAAKWGARGYTESLAAALKGSKIRALAVYPGGMKTPFWSGETGLAPNTDTFMEPYEVAELIFDAAKERRSLKASELTIERN